MRPSILIAGAGQLGSRYLQGLAAYDSALDICVFDISAKSLRRAEERWNEVESQRSHRIVYTTELGALPQTLDIAIVATTADVRADLVELIAAGSRVRCWILEKVLAQSSEDLYRLGRTLQGSEAWVNTPRHQWELYRALHRQYPDSPPMVAKFENFSGLACNAIHFVDFVCRWSGAQLVEIDTKGLHGEWYESKRAGFYEVDGLLEMRFTDGSQLSLASQLAGSSCMAKLEIQGEVWQIDENKGIASTAGGRLVAGRTGLQSQLTAPTVHSILSGVHCGLPTLEESLAQHEVFLNALTAHWNSSMPNKVDRLPIT